MTVGPDFPPHPDDPAGPELAWRTIGFTALTGWVDIVTDGWRDLDDRSEDCPGLLLKETVTLTGRYTRLVAAAFNGGLLYPIWEYEDPRWEYVGSESRQDLEARQEDEWAMKRRRSQLNEEIEPRAEVSPGDPAWVPPSSPPRNRRGRRGVAVTTPGERAERHARTAARACDNDFDSLQAHLDAASTPRGESDDLAWGPDHPGWASLRARILGPDK